MPVYNAEKYLAEAIDSIIQQTYKDWELIIINDGSTDSSEDIIKSYNDQRIHYFENSVNLGVIKTLNKGIDLCSGKYIARMDADDISHSKRLEEQVLFLESHPDYVMCGTNGIIIDKEYKEMRSFRSIPFDEGIRIKLLFSNPFTHPSVMIRTQILRVEKYSEEWKHVEDLELWTRIVEKGKVANLKQQYLTYRWHGDNISEKQSDTQVKQKAEIARRQLSKLGVEASDEELRYHFFTFNPESLNKPDSADINTYHNIDNWFAKLISQNKIHKQYPQDYFIAFLWSRWILLCKKHRRLNKIFSASFISFKPSVCINLCKFLIAGLK